MTSEIQETTKNHQRYSYILGKRSITRNHQNHLITRQLYLYKNTQSHFLFLRILPVLESISQDCVYVTLHTYSLVLRSRNFHFVQLAETQSGGPVSLTHHAPTLSKDMQKSAQREGKKKTLEMVQRKKKLGTGT